MKKIGVVSDTHLKTGRVKLPPPLASGFKNVDMIIHAGDLTTLDVLDELELIAPVKAVCGNCDIDRDASTPPRRIVKVEKCSIGVIHSLGPRRDTYGINAESEFPDSVKCVVFGHSHQPYCEWYNGILLFNPGSPTQRRYEPMKSFGILTVDGSDISGEIFRF